MITPEQLHKINRIIRNTLRNFNKLHAFPLTAYHKMMLQKLLFRNLVEEMKEVKWEHVTKSQQDDYDAKIEHYKDVIQQKNVQIFQLVKKLKDNNLL